MPGNYLFQLRNDENQKLRLGEIMENNKLVSVIIPTYNGSTQLARAIESCLAQTYQNIEIIVVDDNPPNDIARKLTEKVMMRYSANSNVSYVKHETNKNGAAARNTGFQHSKGEYIAFLDDDDYYLPKRIELSVTFLERNPKYGGLIVGAQINRKDGTVSSLLIPKQNLTVRQLLLDEGIIGTGSNIFLRKEIIDEINGFDDTFERRQDIEFMIRVCNITKIGFCPNILVVKDNNGTSNIPSYEKMMSVLSQFNKKFERDINNLSADDKRAFKLNEAKTLFNTAVSSRNNKIIVIAKRNLEKYRKLTFKEALTVILCRLGIFDAPIIKGTIKGVYKLVNTKGNS